MRLYIVTGTSGAGKSTIKDELDAVLDHGKYACVDSDEVGLNWWDYAGTDRESHTKVYSGAGKSISRPNAAAYTDTFGSDASLCTSRQVQIILFQIGVIASGFNDAAAVLKQHPVDLGSTVGAAKKTDCSVFGQCDILNAVCFQSVTDLLRIL